MNREEMVKDSFETMPDRLDEAKLPPAFQALIGFEIGEEIWTLELEGGSCRLRPGSSSECEAILRTGPEEWVDVAAHLVDPTALFLAGPRKVVVPASGDLRVHLGRLFGLTDPGRLEPVWITDMPLFERDEETGRAHALHFNTCPSCARKHKLSNLNLNCESQIETLEYAGADSGSQVFDKNPFLSNQ